MSQGPRLPTIEIYKAVCISCGACEQSCPTDVYRLDPDGYPFAAYPEDCQGCFLCEWDCPVAAIKISVHRWYDAAQGGSREPVSVGSR